jgi:iron complex outermembrane receptor protein
MKRGTEKNLMLCAGWASLLGAAVIALPNAAFAQEKPEAPQPSAGKANGTGAQDGDLATQDIIVTAQKRNENAQKVGIAITAFSAPQLKQLGVLQIGQIARVSPGVNLTGSAGGHNVSFVIRGVQQQDFASIAEGPNAVYIDEGYVGVVNISGIGLFDIDNITILKGPQGTLFGRNATGGVVSVGTRNPSDPLSGFVDLTYGSYETKRAEAAVGGALSDTLSVRLAGLYSANGNYIKNLDPGGGDLGGTRDWGVRGKIDFHPTKDLSFLFTGFATGSKLSWAPYFRQNVIPVFSAGGAVVNVIATDANTGFGPNSDAEGLTLTAHAAQSSGDFKYMQGGNAKIDYETDGGLKITSISDFKHYSSRIDIDNTVTGASILNTHDADNFRSFSEELRAYKAWSHLRWTGGLYYLYMHHRYVSDQDWRNAGSNDVVSDSRLTTQAYAVFSQLEWDFAPKLTVIAGARFTRDEKKYTMLATDPFAGSVVRRYPAAGGDASLNGNLFTGKLALQYQPESNLLIYASYNRGAKAGSFNAPIHANSPPTDEFMPYKPEYLDAYEAGFKLDTLNGMARLNASMFYYSYRNQQVQLFVLPLNSYILNIDNRTYGAEAELRLSPASGLLLSASAAYVNATVKNVALNGNAPADYRPAATPELRLSFLARYEFPFLGGRLALQSDAQYQSKSYLGLTDYAAEEIGAYWLVGANVSWTTLDKKWTATLAAENITDKRYRTLGYDAASFGFEQYAVGRPRWVRFTLGYHF